MTQKAKHTEHTVKINRAPVLTLWAAVVAERLGFEHTEALSLGRAVAGLNAYTKGVSLGLFTPTPKKVKEQRQRLRPDTTGTVELLHRAVPVQQTEAGLRALSGDRPISPESVQRYLESKFGEALDEVYEAMVHLAKSRPPTKLAAEAYHLYEQFRPQVPAGTKGWGAAGVLSLEQIRRLAEAPASRARRHE
jgi:hypothetical protein